MSDQVQDQAASMNPFARLVGVIVSPREAFEDVAGRPAWLFPFVCYLVVFIVAFGVYSMRADWVAIVTDQIENFPLMKMLPEDAYDQAIRSSTEAFRKMSAWQITANGIVSYLPSSLFFFHGMALLYSTLFVMLGSLSSLALGRAWANFLGCLLLYLGFFAIYSVATIAFRDAPQSALLLNGTGAVAAVGGWIWLLNRHAARNPEFHKVLSVCTHAAAVLIVFSFVLLGVSLTRSEPIQVPVDAVVKSNLGAVIKPDAPVLRKLMESLDLFAIWMLAVLTIGFRAATRMSTGVVASLAALPWGLYVMVRLALAAVFG